MSDRAGGNNHSHASEAYKSRNAKLCTKIRCVHPSYTRTIANDAFRVGTRAPYSVKMSHNGCRIKKIMWKAVGLSNVDGRQSPTQHLNPDGVSSSSCHLLQYSIQYTWTQSRSNLRRILCTTLSTFGILLTLW